MANASLSPMAPCVTTNTFGSNLGNLSEYGRSVTADGAFYPLTAAEVAEGPGRPRVIHHPAAHYFSV